MRLSDDMVNLLPLILATFGVAALLSLGLTPLVRRFAIRLDNIDRPDHRRVNVAPIPRGGGMAVAAAFLVVAIALGVINASVEGGLVAITRAIPQTEMVALLVGGAVATILGVLDDTLQLRARWQLVGQVGLAVGAVIAGISVHVLNNPFGPGNIVLDEPYSAAFTVLWIVGMINSINFIDGLDGLSTGISLIAAVTLGLISIAATVTQPFVGLLCFALAGSLLGFLRWNFHPASIFIGTSGVMFVGYTLALLAILGSAKVAVALLVLGVPIIDTFWIIVRRIATGRTPFSPDRGHIHHRLLDLGLTHTQAVVLIYAMCVGLAGLSLVLSGTGQIYAFLGLFVLSGLGLFVLARRTLVAEELSAASYDASDPGEQTDAEEPAARREAEG
jgi:UDP-GlcNAc:undecaprenyl-phosphate GlcNAc-1-phosphate transferase